MVCRSLISGRRVLGPSVYYTTVYNSDGEGIITLDFLKPLVGLGWRPWAQARDLR